MRHGIEDARVLFSSRQPLLGARAISEQTLEGHARIDLGRQRLRRGGPGYRVGVGAAITPVAIPEVADIFDAKLDGRQYRVLAILVRDQLIDRDTEVRTHDRSTDREQV